MSLTHLDDAGRARMVDVTAKEPTVRAATARGFVRCSAEVVAALRDGTVPKGDVLAVARIAGIQAAKRTPELLPLAHVIGVHGASVDLTVQSVPTQQYGVLHGKVKAVDRSAQSAQTISAFLGDSQLGEQFTEDGRPVAVTVELKRSPSTKSGYEWSSADGPPFELTSMTMATGSVRLADQRPVDWLLP